MEYNLSTPPHLPKYMRKLVQSYEYFLNHQIFRQCFFKLIYFSRIFYQDLTLCASF